MYCSRPRVAYAAFAALVVAALPAIARADPGDESGVQAAPVTPAAPNTAGSEQASPAREVGPLGPVRIGAFGGIGFPRPFSVEGMVEALDLVGVGLEYSATPGLAISGLDTSFKAIDLDLRVFPFRNGFFASLAIGRQRFSATATVGLPSVGTVTDQISADSWFVNPRVGFLWMWRWGLTVGIDAGVQIPVSASYADSLPSGLALNQTATSVAHLFGGDVLPTIDLLRLGWVF
jgi:hypothetical protein